MLLCNFASFNLLKNTINSIISLEYIFDYNFCSVHFTTRHLCGNTCLVWNIPFDKFKTKTFIHSARNYSRFKSCLMFISQHAFIPYASHLIQCKLFISFFSPFSYSSCNYLNRWEIRHVKAWKACIEPFAFRLKFSQPLLPISNCQSNI